MSTALNGICPYFTMFPLEFPLSVLEHHAEPGQAVLDPFVGRGTTLYAGRLLGIAGYGIDSNPVAAAVSEAKLVNTSPERVLTAAKHILHDVDDSQVVPHGEFWELAFEPLVLRTICQLREALLIDCRSGARKALRALLLGALHGPLTKSEPSYFSNRCTRTYAPKPRYAVKFWTERGLRPPKVDVLRLIERRATRYYGEEKTSGTGAVALADSTQPSSFNIVTRRVEWIITSPPYYGMRTYRPDQWLRLWFLGGRTEVDYSNEGQLSHRSPDDFAAGLRKVWQNCAQVAASSCKLVVRFGGINDRRVNSLDILRFSIEGTPWRVLSVREAGTASDGKRQAKQFNRARSIPLTEFDVWATLDR